MSFKRIGLTMVTKLSLRQEGPGKVEPFVQKSKLVERPLPDADEASSSSKPSTPPPLPSPLTAARKTVKPLSSPTRRSTCGCKQRGYRTQRGDTQGQSPSEYEEEREEST
ncbi:hypothetical protein FOCC_FOCC009008 [Frankliniella occidentalis]|nr:hypothetical protein FOCC_FOCC009008 [Frankliniella occidentalis]